MKPDVRLARVDELAAALGLQARAFAAHRPVYRVRAELAAQQVERLHQGTRIVAVENGEILGTAQYADHLAHVHIMGLAVAPEWQGQGVARRMIEWIEAKAIDLGHSVLALDTIAEAGNVALFEHLGFCVLRVEEATMFESDAYEILHCVQMERPIS